jgi:branched-subunit amino acid transport protein
VTKVNLTLASCCLLWGISMLSALVVADLMVPDKSFDIGWHQLAASVPALALVDVVNQCSSRVDTKSERCLAR